MKTISPTIDPKLICLLFDVPGGDTVTHPLEPDCSLIVGSDERCGMRISADSISSRHCTVRFQGGDILVMDWCSESGTFVNEQRIFDETLVRANDTLRIGHHELKVIRHDLRAVAPDVNNGSNAVALNDIDLPSNHSSDYRELGAMEHSLESIPESFGPIGEAPDLAVRHARLQAEFEVVQSELFFLRQELEKYIAETPLAMQPCQHQRSSGPTEIDDLRLQLIQLQAELAERDAAILAQWDRDGSNPSTEGEPTAGENEALVERLEQLLDELQSADRRAAALDDLLRSSADEHQAERQERGHLENWVVEIEQRVSEREESWKVERDRMEAKIADLIALRQQADAVAAEALRVESGAPAQEILAELQKKYDRALLQLDQSQQESAKLNQILKHARDSIEQAKRIQELESLIRQRDVEISQERASLSRQRADLDRARADAERSPRSLDNADENDLRIQAFRAHLRGIHEQEQSVQKEQKAASLSARIAKLWQRMDGSCR